MTAVGQWQIHYALLKQMQLLKLQLDAFSFRASAEKAHWLLALTLQDPWLLRIKGVIRQGVAVRMI